MGCGVSVPNRGPEGGGPPSTGSPPSASKDPVYTTRLPRTGQPRELPTGKLHDLATTPDGARKDYAFGTQLGQGSFGVVVLGTHKQTGEKVALKIMDREKIKVTSLQREYTVLETIGSHPGVVGYRGAYKTFAHVTFVLELMEGGELFDRLISRGPFSEAEARHAFKQLAEGLAYLHSRGIIHRDLKPENLLLKRKNDITDIKIADFGLSQVISERERLVKVCGTWAYAAPEMADPARPGYDTRFDTWGFGVILFVAVSGYHPFDPEGNLPVNDIKERARDAKWDFNQPEWKNISPQLHDLLRGLIIKDPELRLPSHLMLKHAWFQDAPAPTTMNVRAAAIADEDYELALGEERRIRIPSDDELEREKKKKEEEEKERKAKADANAGWSTASPAAAMAALRNIDLGNVVEVNFPPNSTVAILHEAVLARKARAAIRAAPTTAAITTATVAAATTTSSASGGAAGGGGGGGGGAVGVGGGAAGEGVVVVEATTVEAAKRSARTNQLGEVVFTPAEPESGANDGIPDGQVFRYCGQWPMWPPLDRSSGIPSTASADSHPSAEALPLQPTASVDPDTLGHVDPALLRVATTASGDLGGPIDARGYGVDLGILMMSGGAAMPSASAGSAGTASKSGGSSSGSGSNLASATGSVLSDSGGSQPFGSAHTTPVAGRSQGRPGSPRPSSSHAPPSLPVPAHVAGSLGSGSRSGPSGSPVGAPVAPRATATASAVSLGLAHAVGSRSGSLATQGVAADGVPPAALGSPMPVGVGSVDAFGAAGTATATATATATGATVSLAEGGAGVGRGARHAVGAGAVLGVLGTRTTSTQRYQPVQLPPHSMLVRSRSSQRRESMGGRVVASGSLRLVRTSTNCHTMTAHSSSLEEDPDGETDPEATGVHGSGSGSGSGGGGSSSRTGGRSTARSAASAGGVDRSPGSAASASLLARSATALTEASGAAVTTGAAFDVGAFPGVPDAMSGPRGGMPVPRVPLRESSIAEADDEDEASQTDGSRSTTSSRSTASSKASHASRRSGIAMPAEATPAVPGTHAARMPTSFVVAQGSGEGRLSAHVVSGSRGSGGRVAADSAGGAGVGVGAGGVAGVSGAPAPSRRGSDVASVHSALRSDRSRDFSDQDSQPSASESDGSDGAEDDDRADGEGRRRGGRGGFRTNEISALASASASRAPSRGQDFSAPVRRGGPTEGSATPTKAGAPGSGSEVGGPSPGWRTPEPGPTSGWGGTASTQGSRASTLTHGSRSTANVSDINLSPQTTPHTFAGSTSRTRRDIYSDGEGDFMGRRGGGGGGGGGGMIGTGPTGVGPMGPTGFGGDSGGDSGGGSGSGSGGGSGSGSGGGRGGGAGRGIGMSPRVAVGMEGGRYGVRGSRSDVEGYNRTARPPRGDASGEDGSSSGSDTDTRTPSRSGSVRSGLGRAHSADTGPTSGPLTLTGPSGGSTGPTGTDPPALGQAMSSPRTDPRLGFGALSPNGPAGRSGEHGATTAAHSLPSVSPRPSPRASPGVSVGENGSPMVIPTPRRNGSPHETGVGSGAVPRLSVHDLAEDGIGAGGGGGGVLGSGRGRRPNSRSAAARSDAPIDSGVEGDDEVDSGSESDDSARVDDVPRIVGSHHSNSNSTTPSTLGSHAPSRRSSRTARRSTASGTTDDSPNPSGRRHAAAAAAVAATSPGSGSGSGSGASSPREPRESRESRRGEASTGLRSWTPQGEGKPGSGARDETAAPRAEPLPGLPGAGVSSERGRSARVSNATSPASSVAPTDVSSGSGPSRPTRHTSGVASTRSGPSLSGVDSTGDTGSSQHGTPGDESSTTDQSASRGGASSSRRHPSSQRHETATTISVTHHRRPTDTSASAASPAVSLGLSPGVSPTPSPGASPLLPTATTTVGVPATAGSSARASSGPRRDGADVDVTTGDGLGTDSNSGSAGGSSGGHSGARRSRRPRGSAQAGDDKVERGAPGASDEDPGVLGVVHPGTAPGGALAH